MSHDQSNQEENIPQENKAGGNVTPDKQEGATEDRRKMLQGAAALAAGAIGAGVVTDAAHAGVRRQQSVARPMASAGAARLKGVKVRDLLAPVRQVSKMPNMQGMNANELINSISEYVQPMLDRGGMTSINVEAVGTNVTVN